MKKKYIITYDLNKPGQDYDSLIEAIKSYDFIKVMKSVWFIRSYNTATEIYTRLRPLIDDSDRLFITEITHNHAGWLDQTVINWLNKD